MLIDFLSDRKILLGIGIGILIATVVMSGVKLASNVNDAEIERRARGLGMDYPSEFRVIEEENK
jgi:hypothetical protein